MHTLITLDTVTFGTKGNCGGWAVFVDERLDDAGSYRVLDDLPRGFTGDVDVVYELPQHYTKHSGTTRQKKADPNMLIRLGAHAGIAAANVCPGTQPVPVLPRQWKGQVPKDIIERRTWSTLNDIEVARLKTVLQYVRPTWRHNVIDAVGIGLWRLCRLPR